jgi:predicted O-methyltransferase YrrM
MLQPNERAEITRLWERKVRQDSLNLPFDQRHRNLEPSSAETISTIAAGIGARQILEIGGSSGISTIALAAAARDVDGRLTSLERERDRQEEARQTLAGLGLDSYVNFILGEAADALPTLPAMNFVLIDCEKDDYIPFFNMLAIAPGGVVVADNIISHSLVEYSGRVRAYPDCESLTLPIGKGLEITWLSKGKTSSAVR